MDSNKIKVIILLVLSAFAALYLGVSAATAQAEAVAWVAGALVFAGCLSMGTKIWMLIPIAIGMRISFPFLPGGPTLLQASIAAAFAFSFLLLLVRRLPWRLQLGPLEICLLILIATILQAYMRHPVGLNVIGTGSIGGRGYFEVGIAIAGCLLLFGMKAPFKDLRIVAISSIAFGILASLLGVAAYLLPGIALLTGPILGTWGGMSVGGPQMSVDPGDADRKISFRDLGDRLSDWIIFRINPIRSLIHPLWGLLLIVAVTCGMLSGFRSSLLGFAMAFGLATAYRGGMRSVMLGSLAACFAVGILAGFNAMVPLPPNIQRALSFLPGTWDRVYVRDGEGSTDWRLEMWEAALFTDDYIDNKVLGDGLGISAREARAHQTMEALKVGGGGGGFDMQREYALMVGDYHSGPVHTIRTVGYVGLVIVWIIFGVCAWKAHKLLLRVKGTRLFNTCCLMCIPMIWHPIYFTFVFGAFGKDISLLVIHLGLLRLMEGSVAKELAVIQLDKEHAGSSRVQQVAERPALLGNPA